MPSRDELRKQVEVGINYWVVRGGEVDDPALILHLTDHLWGTVGMWLTNSKLSREETPHLRKDSAYGRNI